MKITLAEWARRNYDPPPSNRIISAWSRSGQIHPAPERVGLRLMVDERAVRIPMQEIIEAANMSERALRILRST
jgi:hypothetical protein